VADCTYNPDSVPDLVSTLGNIARVRDDREVEGEREGDVGVGWR